MGEMQRISVPNSATRSAATSAARESQGGSRARTDRHEADAPALRHMLAMGALQPRLTVGPADDPYEREAERTADLVMSPDMTSKMSGPAIPRPSLAASLSRVVQRAMGKMEPPVRKDDDWKKKEDEKKKDDDRKKTVQKKSAGPAPSVVPSRVEQTIETLSAGGGSPLPESLRARFEPRFGYDFGAVRVHTGEHATGAATALGARAFTVGDHLFFGAGEYQPTSTQGQRLIAHELTHVVQQGADPRRVQRRPIVSWQLGGTTFFKARSGDVIELPDDMTVEQVVKLEDDAIAAERRLAELPPPKPVPEVHKPAPKPEKTPPPKVKPRAKRHGGGKAPPKAAEATAALMKAVGGGKVAQYLAAKGGPVFAKGAAKLATLKAHEQTHEDAGEKLKRSEDAVVIPASEEQATGNAGQVGVVGDRVAPVIDETKGKRTLAASLAANVPKSIGVLDNFQRDKKAQHTGAEVLAVVQEDKNAVTATFGDVRLTPPPVPSGHEPVPLPPAEGAPPTPAMHLGAGAVAPLLKEHTDVSEYTKQADTKLQEEGVSQEQLDMVDSGDLAEANKEKKGMKKLAATEPIAVQKMANDERTKVDKELAHEEQTERGALAARRKSALTATGGKQKDTRTALEKKRDAVAKEINDRYTQVQNKVTKRLADLETESMKRFDDGNAAAAKDFEADVKRELDAYKDDRYSGWFGWARKAKDWLLGMDDLPRVKAIFENNRAAFVKRIDKLVADIAADNARVIKECHDELTTSKQKIDEYVAGLEPALQDIGKKAAAEMGEKLAELDKTINRKEEELKAKLKDKQTAAIKAIDEKIEKMKEAMSGALAKLGRLLLKAAKKFFTWALEKFGLSLSTIESIIDKGVAVLKAVFTHPIQFVKNLIGAAKSGFLSFAKNFVTHLKDAVFEWLTGSLEGITLPSTWTLREIVGVLFQLVGLTWANIKKALVKLIPEPVVEGLKTTFGLVKTLISDGPMAAWEQIKEMAEDLKQTFVASVTDWIKWTVVEQAVKTIVAMFVPGAGIIRAIIGIYDTIVFFIQKARDIMQMIGSFLGSIAEIAAGNIGEAAQALENGLARGLKLVISFLAKFLHLDGITARIRQVLEKVRAKVDAVLDKVAGWVVGMAKKAGKLLGIGGKEAPKDVKDGAVALEDPKWKVAVAGVHADVTALKSQKKASAEHIEAAIPGWKSKYAFKSLHVDVVGTHWSIKGSMSPEQEVEHGDDAMPPALSDVHEGVRYRFPKVKDPYARFGKANGPPIGETIPGQKGKQWLIAYWANKRMRGKSSPVLFKTPAFDGKGTEETNKVYNVAGEPGAITPKIVSKTVVDGKTTHVHANPLWTTPYDPASGSPSGWDRLDASKWFRVHLINGSMGGPGVGWNTVPAPVLVNNTMRDAHEKVLREGLANLKAIDNASYWKKISVGWRSDAEGAPRIGKASDFPAYVTVEYGDSLLDVDGKWIEQPATNSQSYPIRLPLESELLPLRRFK